MALATDTLPAYFNSDADFRNWGSGIADALVAAGLVQTADTGQIDWGTVLKPSTGTEKMGYEIYRFNDSEQATNPCFIRVDFGSGASGGNGTPYPGLWITIGTGTDGAGAITGGSSETRAVSYYFGSPKSAGETAGIRAAAGSGYVAFIGNIDSEIFSSGTPDRFIYGFAVERVRETDGSFRTDGALTLLTLSYDGSPDYNTSTVIGGSETTSSGGSSVGKLNTPHGSGNDVDGNVPLFPFFPIFGGGYLPPMISMVGYRSADITNEMDGEIELYGTSRSYRTIDVSSLSLGPIGGAANESGVAMIAE